VDEARKKELTRSYLTTDYAVDDHGIRSVIRIGTDNREMDELLVTRGASDWVFIASKRRDTNFY
jgi:hypothetical protein